MSSAPPSMPCDWHSDHIEPELDDLAYQHAPPAAPRPEDQCDWQGDPAEPETDDLAYQHAHEPNSTPPGIDAPEPTPQILPLLPLAVSETEPMPQVKAPPASQEEPEDHHAEYSPPPLPDSPPQLVEVPAAVVVAHPDEPKTRKEKRKEEKAREHEARHLARREKERAKKELKILERAERKAKDQEKREARERLKQERKARKSRGHCPGSPHPEPELMELMPEPIPEAEMSPDDTIRADSTQEARFPILDDLTDSIRKILPKQGPLSKSRKQSKTETNDGQQPSHQGLDGSSDLRPVSGQDSRASVPCNVAEGTAATVSDAPESTAPCEIHSDLRSRPCECGHSSNVPRNRSPLAQKKDQTGGIQKMQQPASPGKLKRASCLCGVMPPNPSELAAYETPLFLTPRIDTPGHEEPFSTKSYFA